jgi:hypothetical protein
MPSRFLAWLRASALVVVVLLMAAASSGSFQSLKSGGLSGQAPVSGDASLELLPVRVASAQDDDDDDDEDDENDDDEDDENDDEDEDNEVSSQTGAVAATWSPRRG